MKNIQKTCYSFGGKPITFPPKGPAKKTLNWPLTGAVHSGECYKMPRRPFSKLCSNLCAYCSNKLPERGPTIARLRVLSIMPLRAWAHRRSAYTQLSPLYLLYTLHITHMIKYTRPSPAFPYCKWRKVGQGLGEADDFLHWLLPFCIATFTLTYVPTS